MSNTITSTAEINETSSASHNGRAASQDVANKYGPKLRGPLPGPKAKAIVEADDRLISPSYTRSYPLVAKRGRGVRIEDVDGNEFIAIPKS
jgi:4-aminobutyrate aminotransferase